MERGDGEADRTFERGTSWEVDVEECLTTLLAPGSRARDGARALLAATPLVRLARGSAAELQGWGRLTPSQARRVVAAFALGRVVERARLPRGVELSRPGEVHRLLAPELRGVGKETFVALYLDTRHRLVARERVSVGTLSTSLVHPREVFGPALRAGAAAVIVAHNHPSGDPRPSGEDVEVTRRLAEVGRLVGVPLLDHVVIGDGGWVSLVEHVR